MNRIEIKEKAKEIMKQNLKSFWKGYLLILLIFLLCNAGIELLFNENSTIYACLTLVTSFFISTLSVGFNAYTLKMIRKEEFRKEDIFQFIGNIFPIVAISLLIMLFVLIGGIFFIIPGIIIALSYSMVFYIYTDNQELTPMDYLEKSRNMMKGYKWNYFIFGLSFIGCVFLSIITFGVGLIWTVPYVCIAEAIYYDELKKQVEKEKKEKI